MTTSRMYNLGDQEADLAFRVVPFEEPDVVQRRLMTIHFAVYAAVGLSVASGTGGEGLELIEVDPAYANPDVGWLRRQLPAARVVLCSSNRTLQARMCAKGVDLAVLPCFVGDQTPDIRRIDLSGPPPTRNLWMGLPPGPAGASGSSSVR